MRKASTKASSSAPRKTSADSPRTYRGVVLQKPAAKSRYSAKQVDDAVRAAIAKNSHVFAGDN